ncbi:putative ABC transport system permease protein [Inquilinus ginsengisoli]|uniref:ABC transport system permease protein n=1 Tax=Inquilinus ginsengisoli TaxID=363840 RepID=A0ABU1JTP2_9PROT|nr:ABC transporter permease [Inquilinus ginsengisoli]MDR6290944.1 putative ABC transport system permease protein [Inquilinus ginsengisoli]
MSLFAFLGAIEIGLIYALVALGVFLSFRVLNFPDLTVDGSFPLGAATSATLIVAGVDPVLATLVGVAAGALAGLVTAWLNVRFGILHLLASILTMISLFSINLRIMGKPNVALINQDTVINLFSWLTPTLESLGLPGRASLKVVVLAVIVLIVTLLLGRFLTSEFGLAMRATGANSRMARAQGISTKLHIYVGMALSNALVALAGALFAQTAGFADVTVGTGTIVVGLAAVILGETMIRTRRIVVMLAACVLGAVIYRIVIALALNTSWLGLQSSDLNLVTALLVGIALMLPGMRNPLKSLFRRSA